MTARWKNKKKQKFPGAVFFQKGGVLSKLSEKASPETFLCFRVGHVAPATVGQLYVLPRFITHLHAAPWHDLANTAEKVRSFLGIDGKLYDLAKKTLGTHNASIVIAYILQRYEQIQSAGGYLRILTEKAANGSFSIRPMLMAALNGQNR